MIVLDTNVFSEALRPRPDERVLGWYTEVGEELAITAVTVGEVLRGVRSLPEGRRRSALMDDVEELFMRFAGSVLPYDDAAAHRFAVMQEARRSTGRPLSTEDGMIAGICRAHSLRLATRNIKDFRELDIELVDPWTGEAN